MLETEARLHDTAVDAAARIALLESENERLRADMGRREQRIRLLEEALRVLKADRFGASREKLSVAPGQSALFNEAEAVIELTEAVGTELELKATPQRENKKRSSNKPGRKAIAAHLPRVQIFHELPESERHCACGGTLVEIGSEVSEQLDYLPAKVQVLQHVRKKYACPGCEQCLKTAALPPQILPKTNAAPGLLAHVATAKYVDALPLYRQEAIFERHGVNLPRATQAAWIIGLAERVQPLINLMDERLRESGYIRMDETPVQVLKSALAPTTKHYMWVQVAGPPRQRIILFDYDASRGAEVAARLLEGVSGYLQSDGHWAYDEVSERYGLTHCGCIAHARRRFFEAIKALPKAEQKADTAAHEGVRRIDVLYAIEREAKGLTDGERTALRQQKAVPLLNALYEWASALVAQTLPSGKLGDALSYLIKQWPKLIRYVDDGRLAIDTNLAENAIRPFALGRRNWLFADTVKGAKASASLYSLVQTARANELEPYAYLRRLFEQLPAAQSVADFEALLPWNNTPAI
ncbi:MAG: IS66 family transposase [Steroidobacteraceae bacterium]